MTNPFAEKQYQFVEVLTDKGNYEKVNLFIQLHYIIVNSGTVGNIERFPHLPYVISLNCLEKPKIVQVGNFKIATALAKHLDKWMKEMKFPILWKQCSKAHQEALAAVIILWLHDNKYRNFHCSWR